MRKHILVLVFVVGAVMAASVPASAQSFNFTDTDIRATWNCSSGWCTGQFESYICNTDPTYPRGMVVGAKWDTAGTVTTCQGYYDSTNTTTVSANSCKWVLDYGPGFVGTPLYPGSVITVTTYADVQCQQAESNENDNAKTKAITVGP